MTWTRRSRFDPQEYEKRTYRKLGGTYASEAEISDVLRLCGQGPTVLEIGMGTGRVFQRLANQHVYTVGLDPDVRMAKQTAKRMGSLGPEKRVVIDLVVADGEHLPFRESAFDSIVCVRVLRYFNQPRKAIEGMCKVLKSRGRLVLEFANVLRPQTILEIPKYLLEGQFYPRLFWRRQVEEWVSQQGMQIEDVLGWHKVPVEVLGLINSRSFLRGLLSVERKLQRVSPPEFMSRSLLLSAIKS